MENSVKIKECMLNLEHFEQFPVWASSEDPEDGPAEDLVCPVVKTDPLPEDLGRLYIKADFLSKEGYRFKGYVVAVGEAYAIFLFVDDQEFGFNVHCSDFAERDLDKLRKVLGDENAQIFPIRYETKFRYAGEDPIAGIFDPIKH